jgi:hypothetical protein
MARPICTFQDGRRLNRRSLFAERNHAARPARFRMANRSAAQTDEATTANEMQDTINALHLPLAPNFVDAFASSTHRVVERGLDTRRGNLVWFKFNSPQENASLTPGRLVARAVRERSENA